MKRDSIGNGGIFILCTDIFTVVYSVFNFGMTSLSCQNILVYGGLQILAVGIVLMGGGFEAWWLRGEVVGRLFLVGSNFLQPPDSPDPPKRPLEGPQVLGPTSMPSP